MTATSTDVVVIDCVEYEHLTLDPALWLGEQYRMVLNSEIDGHDILRANFQKGVLKLQATSYIGVIPINDRVVLRVRPRMPLSNLTRMVVETGHKVLPLTAFREYSGSGTADEWVMDIYTDALIGYIDQILDLGMLREYRRRTDEGRIPHGRIDYSRTVQRFAGRNIPNKVGFTWFERTTDTASNRCLRAAMEEVHNHLTSRSAKPRKGDRAKLARLAGQFQAFEEVSRDPQLRFLEDQQVTGVSPLPDSRAYYRPALDLSALIVRGEGIALELGGDDVEISSLLIDTSKLFENFVRVSLAKLARKLGWAIDVLDGNTDGSVPLYDVPEELPRPLGLPVSPLAVADRGRAQPDIVFRALDGGVPLVAEVKNTAHGKGGNGKDVLPDRDEVEQAVTYALRYGLAFALLIHPWVRGSKGLVYAGRVRSVDVYDYRLDLSVDEHMDDALADMASALAGLANLTDYLPTSA